MDTTWQIRQIEGRENSFFYCSRVTWCSTRTHTLTPPLLCLDTP